MTKKWNRCEEFT